MLAVSSFSHAALYSDVKFNPTAYGIPSFIENCGAITNSLNDGGTNSANCGSLFFVDPTGHYSAMGNQIIAQAAYAAVVLVPAAGWFFAKGLMALVGMRKTMM